MNEQEIREQICDVCHKMWQQGWVAANDGNVSVKIGEDLYLATPTGISKSFITPEKLIKINGQGEVLEALEGYRPSSEIKMHLRCYKEREDVRAVVHAHPPTATGYAVAGKSLDEYSMIETVIAIGSIPLTPYGTPSTYEVPDAIAPYLAKHDVLLLQNHGALTVGSDVITAYYRMESLELWAKITINAIILGGSYKKADYHPLGRELVRGNITHAVLIGDTADAIEAALKDEGFTHCVRAGYDFQKAIETARSLAAPGGNVLLSPACASFDMFSDYEARGREFKRIVKDLEPNMA